MEPHQNPKISGLGRCKAELNSKQKSNQYKLQLNEQNLKQKKLSEQELILKAKQLQYSLQLIGLQQKQQKQQNLSDQDNLMKKQLKLNELIAQIKDAIDAYVAEDSQQNKQFIQEQQFKLNQALQLKSCYQSLIKIHQKPNLQDQLLDHLKFFGMESKPIGSALQELRKKKELNIRKIQTLKKKKSYQEIKKFQHLNHKIYRIQQLINEIRVSESKYHDKQDQKLQQEPQQNPGKFKNQNSGSFIKNVPEFHLIFYEKGVQCFRMKINQSMTLSQVLRELKIDREQKNFNFYYRNDKLNKKQLIDIHVKIGSFICQPIQNDCCVQIEQYITIKLDNNDVRRFQKGTSLFEIQKRLGIKSKDFYFFFNSKVYTIEDALHNLEIRQCEVIKVKYLGKVLKCPIPTKISFKEVIRYIQFQKYNSQIVQTIYIAKVKVQGKELDVNQSFTLQQFSLGLINQEVEQLIVEYKIRLKIQIQSFQQFEMEVSSRKKIFEIKSRLQRICKMDKKFQKWNHAGMELQNQKSFQQLGLIKSEIKIEVVQKKYKPIMTFFVESMEIGKIPIQLHKNIKQHMISLNKQQLINGNNKYYLKSRLEGKTTQISENQNLNNVLDLKNLFSYEHLYQCSIQQLIQIKLDNNQIKYFKKGVKLNMIRNTLKIKGRNYIFFKDFRQFNQDKTYQNLELHQCYNCNVKYLNKKFNQVIVPKRVKFCQLIKYIQFQNIYTQSIQTIKILKLRLQEQKKSYQYDVEPNQTIDVFLQSLKRQAQIQDIILGYVINLKLQVMTKNYKQDFMEVNSKETILQLKQKFEQSCKLDKKLQKWSYEGALLTNNKNFEDYQIFQSHAKIQVNEIKNLQYYGFQTEDPIDSNLYTNYYVQDDDQFKRQLEKYSFPDKQYEHQFRIKSTTELEL